MPDTKRGFGIAASLAPEIIEAAAELAESLGYDSFWANYTLGNSGLAALARAASRTRRIRLGVGVIPLSGRAPIQIQEEIKALKLPEDRLILGVGSGSANVGTLELVRNGVAALRELTNAEVAISALGPRMCRLAGEVADGVLYNWLSPGYATRSNALVEAGARASGRSHPTIYAYVRTAFGAEAGERLLVEGSGYNRPGHYGDHFQRMGEAPEQVSVAGNTPDAIQSGLASWDVALDETVVRAVTAHDTLEQTLELVRAARPSVAARS